MAKRRLSLQQRRRITAAQAKSSAVPGGPEFPGTVVAHFGSQADVEIAAASGQREIVRCHIRANVAGIATGDQVSCCQTGNATVITAVHDRRSEIVRPDKRGSLRTIAANVDVVGVVVAPVPELHANLLDRYLVAAQACGVRPIIICNKTDLFATTDENPAAEQLALYRELGYELHFVSARGGTGIASLAESLRNITTIFTGQSGVGKSSLINALCPASMHTVGKLSDAKAKGIHTTTAARLCHLPQGGIVIDSPGIREFGLWHLNRRQVDAGFIEFRPLLGHCKFRDCSHRHEPGCAILEAVAQGRITEQRLESYRLIVGDAASD